MQLKQVKKAFEDSYRTTKNTADDGGVKYSISEIVDEGGNSFGIGVHLDSTLLDNLTPKERVEMVKECIKDLGGKSFTAYDTDDDAVEILIARSNAYFKNENGKKRTVNNDLARKHINNEVKQEALVLVDELINTSKFKSTDPAKHAHSWLDNNGQNTWDVWTTYIQDKNNAIWETILHVANTTKGDKILYDVVPTKKVGQSGKSDTSLPFEEEAGRPTSTSSVGSIRDSGKNVNPQFSLSEENAMERGGWFNGEELRWRGEPADGAQDVTTATCGNPPMEAKSPGFPTHNSENRGIVTPVFALVRNDTLNFCRFELYAQKMPWAIMASATFMKPARLAPATRS